MGQEFFENSLLEQFKRLFPTLKIEKIDLNFTSDSSVVCGIWCDSPETASALENELKEKGMECIPRRSSASYLRIKQESFGVLSEILRKETENTSRSLIF